MKKITVSQFGGPEMLELVDVPAPKPGAEDVLVKAHAIGVGWPDVYVRTGTYPWMHLFSMPLTPGVEMSGTVAAVGSAVTQLRPGQPVYVTSGLLGMAGSCYTEALVAPQDSIIALPQNLSLEAAANLSYYALALQMLRRCGQGRDIRWVLVSGASGGLGTALVQVAKAIGHRVIATVGQEHKRSHSLAMGADHVLNYREDDLRAAISDFTQGAGVDLWLESYVGPQLADVLDHIAPWGMILLYNATGGHPSGSFFDVWRKHMAKCISIQYFSVHVWERDRSYIRTMIEEAAGLMASGALTPPPGTFYAMEDVAEAHRLLESGRHVGRIFLRP